MMIRRLHTLKTSFQDLGHFQAQVWLLGLGLGPWAIRVPLLPRDWRSSRPTRQPVDLFVVVVAYHYHDSQSLRGFTSSLLAKISRSRHLLSS